MPVLFPVAIESLQCRLKCQFSSSAMQLEEAVGEFGCVNSLKFGGSRIGANKRGVWAWQGRKTVWAVRLRGIRVVSTVA